MSDSAELEQGETESSSEITRLIEETGNKTFKVNAEVREGETSCAILRFVGSLNNKDSRVLRYVLAYLNRKPVEIVILDLSRITRIDSTPLAALLMFVKERESMRYALACAIVLNGQDVLEKINVLGIAPMFEIFESLQEAEYNLGVSGRPDFTRRFTKRSLNMKTRVKLITSHPRTAIITLSGHIQGREAEQLSWLLRQVSRRGARDVIIDMSGITYANTPAYGVLASATRCWQEAYGRRCIALVGLNASLMRTIEVLGVQQHFIMAAIVKEARKMLQSGPAEKPTACEKRLPRPSRRL